MTIEEPRFGDWVRLLRYWLAMRNVPDRGKIRIEVLFPDEKSQAYAFAALRQELTPSVMANAGMNFPRPEALEFEGVKIVFTHPGRWDERRA